MDVAITPTAHKKMYHGTSTMYHGTLSMYRGTLAMYHGTFSYVWVEKFMVRFTCLSVLIRCDYRRLFDALFPSPKRLLTRYAIRYI